jgi:MFS family permease
MMGPAAEAGTRMRSKSTILILGAAQFVMVLDTTVMNVSISEVVADLDTTVPQVQLAITAYALVMAAFMLTGAKLGDMYGRRRIFAIGLAVYGTGSLITSLSPSVGVLLVGWSLIEGIGAVLVIPAIAALTAANYSGKERAIAYGLLGGIAGAGVAAGPLIGGFITTALTWRVVFAAETFVVLAILLFGVRRINPGPSVEREKLDLVGAGLSAVGLGLVVFGILKSSQWGLVAPTGALTIGGEEITPFGLSAVPFIVAAGIVVLGSFRAWERRLEERGDRPLLRPGMLKVPQLRGGLTMFVSSYLLMAGTFFVLPLYLQLVIGDDTLETGIKILPISVAMMLAAITGARLADRISPRRIVRIGLLLLFIGLVGAMSTISPTLDAGTFAISLAFFGAGVGLIVSQLGNVVMSSVGEERASEAGGLQGAAQSLGSSLGTALIGAILLAGLTTGLHDKVRADESIPPEVREAIVSGSEQGVPMVSSATAEATAEDAGLPTDQVSIIVDHYEDAQIDALKRALLGASFFALFAFWIAGDLPGRPLGSSSEKRTSSSAPAPIPASES